MDYDENEGVYFLEGFQSRSKKEISIFFSISIFLGFITSIYLVNTINKQYSKALIILIPYYIYLGILFYHWLKFSKGYDNILLGLMKAKDKGYLGIVSGRKITTYSFEIKCSDFEIKKKLIKILWFNFEIFDLVFLQEEIDQKRCITKKSEDIKNYILYRSYFKREKVEKKFDSIKKVIEGNNDVI